MAILLIRDEDVRKALTFEDAIEAIEDAYRQDGRGHARGLFRRELRVSGLDLLHTAPGITGIGHHIAYLEESNALAVWHVFRFPIPRFIFHLINPSDGRILAIIESPYGMWLRTAVAGAVAAKYLAREDSTTAGIIGTGRVGRGQLIALSKVREIRRVYVYSGRRRDEDFAREMSSKLGMDVTACDGAEKVVRNADILITATRATTPIVKGEWMNEGLLINGIGADVPTKAELDASVFKRSDKIVIDGEQALKIGEIAVPIKQGILKPEDIYGKIGEIIAGVKPGREDDAEIITFESTGLSIQDTAIAAKIYQKVKEMKLGIERSEYAVGF